MVEEEGTGAEAGRFVIGGAAKASEEAEELDEDERGAAVEPDAEAARV